MEANREYFRAVSEFTNYEISSVGRVRNSKTGRVLKTQPRKDGYVGVQLSKDGKYKNLLMHRLVALAFIENPLGKPDVDHIDRNKSNNSVDNLRWSTTSENLMNSTKRAFTSSIYKGVYFHGQSDRWRAQVRINGIANHLGGFRTEKEAAESYNAFAALHFGVRANLNTITN
jgi:hypothetical protein